MKRHHERIPQRIAVANGFDGDTRSAYAEAVRRFAGKPWVTGVSISMREADSELHPMAGPVIAIHVVKKVKRSRNGIPSGQRIPATIAGVPTDIIEARYERHGGGGAAVAAALSLGPGASIGRRVGGTAATLGAFVIDEQGRTCVLCAAHMLREGGKFKKGDRITHPGPADDPGCVDCAIYDRVHLDTDSGVAVLLDGVIASNTALVTGVEIGPPDHTTVGDVLEKVGRTTRQTQAIVQGIGTFVGLFPAMQLRPLPGDPDPSPLSDAGDSGAVWYDPVTCAGRALHSSGTGPAPPGKEFGIATVLPYICSRLKVSWATS